MSRSLASGARRGLLARAGFERPWLLLGALVFSASALLLGFLVLAIIPWNAIPFPGEGAGSSEAPALVRLDAFELLVVVLASLACLATYVLQRKQADRYSPPLLVAMPLGLFAGGYSIRTMSTLASNEAVRHTVRQAEFCAAALALTSALGLATLLHLLLTRSPQRGRCIALFLTVWAGSFAFAQKAWVVDSPGIAIPSGEIELAHVPGELCFIERPVGPEGRTYVSIDAKGDVLIDGVKIPIADEVRLRATLVAQTTGYARADPCTFWLAVDGRAPLSSVVRVAQLSAEPGVGVCFHRYLVRADSAWHPHWNVASLTVHTGCSSCVHHSHRVPDQPRPVLEVRSTGQASPPEYAWEGIVTQDFRGLLRALDQTRANNEYNTLILRAHADTDWETVATLLDRLGTPGRWNVGQLTVKE